MRRAAFLAAVAALCAASASAQDAPRASRTQEKLAGLRVTATFNEVPLDEVLDVLSDKGGVAVRVDPEATVDGKPASACKVTLRFDNLPLGEAVRRAANEFGFKVAVGEGLVLLSRRDLSDVAWPELPGRVAAALDARTISVRFAGTPLADALAMLSAQGGAPARTEPGLAKRPVTLAVDNLTPRAILSWIAMTQNLSVIVRGDAVVVTYLPGDARLHKQLDETKVSLTFNEQPVMEALDFLVTLGKLNIVPDRTKFADAGKTVTLKLEDASLREALDQVILAIGLAWTVRDGVVFITDAEGVKRFTPPPPRRSFAADRPSAVDRKVLAQIDDTSVSFTFNEQPVFEALDFLATLGKVNIVPDRAALKDPEQTVTIKLENVPLRTAIILIAEQLGLRWVIRDGVVFISDEATIRRAGRAHRDFAADKPAAADLAVYRMLQNTLVSFTFNEQPVNEVFDFLEGFGKFGVVPDRAKFEDPAKMPTVTLKLDNVPLLTAWNLLTEQLGMTWIIREGRLHVSE